MNKIIVDRKVLDKDEEYADGSAMLTCAHTPSMCDRMFAVGTRLLLELRLLEEVRSQPNCAPLILETSGNPARSCRSQLISVHVSSAAR